MLAVRRREEGGAGQVTVRTREECGIRRRPRLLSLDAWPAMCEEEHTEEGCSPAREEGRREAVVCHHLRWGDRMGDAVDAARMEEGG